VQEFESLHLRQKETTMLARELSFLFVLFSFLSSLFTFLLNCRLQIREKSEKRTEAVSALRMIKILWARFTASQCEIRLTVREIAATILSPEAKNKYCPKIS
jgi:hypothetical protein